MSISSDDESEQPKTELDLIREQNIKEQFEFLEQLHRDIKENHPDLVEFFGISNEKKPANTNREPKRRKIQDENVSFRIRIPKERRKSQRLAGASATYSYKDLDDIEEPVLKDRSTALKVSNLVQNFAVRKKKSLSLKRTPVPVLDVTEVTESILENIAYHTVKKTYSANGTTCHQCRQKTLDTKTVCRSGNCSGIRGQFCGICLKNRYGEHVKDALQNAEWSCPPCRDLCNCSICRNNAGKRPTGILTPLARKEGYDNVKDFLDGLHGRGDFSSDNEADENESNSNEDFIGFVNNAKEDNLNYVIKAIEKLENELYLVDTKYESFKGFSIEDTESNNNYNVIISVINKLQKELNKFDLKYEGFKGFHSSEVNTSNDILWSIFNIMQQIKDDKHHLE